jgi:rhodanese-related sulfurtransferase
MSMWTIGDKVPEVDPHRADEMVRSGTAVLVDYGEPHDWFAGHLPNAVLLSSNFPLDRDRLPTDRTLIVGARRPGLGEELVEELNGVGRDAMLLRGGPSGWASAGFALQMPDGTPRR